MSQFGVELSGGTSPTITTENAPDGVWLPTSWAGIPSEPESPREGPYDTPYRSLDVEVSCIPASAWGSAIVPVQVRWAILSIVLFFNF